MCGIFGFIGKISRDQATACLNTLAHRGPDGSGLWQQDDVTLGHRRLSILDLSDNAKQPMTYADGRYVITFNGEIYNFVELRKELERRGYGFQSESDTEVILAAFVAWGEGCLDRFNGMWAFAVWDCREKSLFLARDRFGKKPLFYAELPGGQWTFASEMKAIFPLLEGLQANEALVRDATQIFHYEASEECVIEGIKRFPAGHFGWYRDGLLSKTRWWCTLDHVVEVPSAYEEQVEQFREIFLDACRLRMRSDVPIGTSLSGGLDSSATISSVAFLAGHGGTERMGRSWQHAFVASFPGTPVDETEYAMKVANHLGVEATIIDIDPVRAIGDLSKYLYLFEDLYITSPIPFMLTYQAVKERGVSVTLDGHGADELFGGYTFDYLVALEDAGLNLRKASQILNTYYEASPQKSAQFDTLPPKLLFWSKWVAKRTVKRLLGRAEVGARDHNHSGWRRLDTLGQQLYRSTHDTILPTLLRNYDRYSMANGVEIRMPFMDHRVVTYAFSLPWNSKIRNGFSKAIVRDAVARYMPADVAYRKTKIGFNSPIVDWMKGPLRSFMLDTIGSQSFKECALIDSAKVASTVRYVIDAPEARFSDGERAWTLLSPFLWEQAVLRVSHS